MKNNIIVLLVLSLFIQCKEKSVENAPVKNEPALLQDSAVQIKSTANTAQATPLLPNLPEKTLPLTDSTNFDNYDLKKGIKDDLFLEKIKIKKHLSDADNIRLRYRLNFSPNFQTVVLSYNKGEMEIFTTLFNFNRNYEIIDQLDISYDEIAESAFRKFSLINKGQIVVTDWNYMNEPPLKTVKKYLITKEGKFQEVKK